MLWILSHQKVHNYLFYTNSALTLKPTTAGAGWRLNVDAWCQALAGVSGLAILAPGVGRLALTSPSHGGFDGISTASELVVILFCFLSPFPFKPLQVACI